MLAQVSVDGAVLGTKQMGDTLGEMALVSSQKRAADVLAISLCELAVLRRDDYLTVVSEKQNETLELKRELIRGVCYAITIIIGISIVTYAIAIGI